MDGTALNILSNNCLGGFIYRDVMRVKYANPFIWTLFDDETFIKMLLNYNSINFSHFMVNKQSADWSINNDFDTIIDDEYQIHNIHMHFDPSASTPQTMNNGPAYQRSLWTNGIRYSLIWEYIFSSYQKRLFRMKRTTSNLVIFWSKTISNDALNRLIDIPIDKKWNAIIFDSRFKYQNDKSAKIKLCPVPNKIERPQLIIQMYNNFIGQICKDILQ